MLVSILNKIIFQMMCCVIICDLCVTKTLSLSEKMAKCDELPFEVLKRLHGPAFDSRYMSNGKPPDDGESPFDQSPMFSRKRSAQDAGESFYINDDHTIVLSEEPAWNFDWGSFKTPSANQMRKRRSLPPITSNLSESIKQTALLNRDKRHTGAPWQCEKKLKWVHLGPDYHPAYLRSIECTKSKCYYNVFDCKPRKFQVRVLQRRRGACADASSLRNFGFTGKYAEIWEWVVVSVTFCCDCTPPKNYY